MKLANDWYKSKTFTTALLPLLAAAYEAHQQGAPLWQSLVIGAVGTGLFGIRDTIAKHRDELVLVQRLLAGLQQITQQQTATLVEQHTNRLEAVEGAAKAQDRTADGIHRTADAMFQLLGERQTQAAEKEKAAADVEPDGECDAV